MESAAQSLKAPFFFASGMARRPRRLTEAKVDQEGCSNIYMMHVRALEYEEPTVSKSPLLLLPLFSLVLGGQKRDQPEAVIIILSSIICMAKNRNDGLKKLQIVRCIGPLHEPCVIQASAMNTM